MISNKFSNSYIIDKFRSSLPKLVSDLHKGQCGRIGIVGGSKEYTGAPYYAGICSLRVGADLCYVLASKEATQVIKSYSPELIVFPFIDNENEVQIDIPGTVSKMHSIVIGPGLGRTEKAWKIAKLALQSAKEYNIPIILDADSLFMIQYDLGLINGYKKCILTPNAMEFKRIYETVMNENYNESKVIEEQCSAVKRLALRLNKVTILKKGRFDIMSDGDDVLVNDAEGSNRRCGGQGDLISGALGTFSYWTNSEKNEKLNNNNDLNPNLVAAYCATTMVKCCNKESFAKYKRSMLTTDMIQEIPNVFQNLFDA